MENTALIHAAVRNAINGIITVDNFETVNRIYPSERKSFAHSEEEVLGDKISLLMPTPSMLVKGQYLLHYPTTSKPHNKGIRRELLGKFKEDFQFPFKPGVNEVTYSGRKISAGLIQDPSQQKRDEEYRKKYEYHLEELVEQRTKTLKDTIKALEKSKEKVCVSLEKEKNRNKLKNCFVSMASHEFRTPLSTAYLSASLIEKYAESLQSPNITKHASKIISAVTNLTTVLNDFLSIEQLEIGMVKTNPTCFDLVQLAKEITEDMQLVAKDGQVIKFSHLGTQRLINLDQNLLKNSIINLITNAIKYSPNFSRIEFTTQTNDTHCIITVKDDGIGIPKEDQQHLFEPFFRAQNTGTIPGTGLGLNIVAQYIALMNGHISYSSTIGKGSLFTLTFSMI